MLYNFKSMVYLCSFYIKNYLKNYISIFDKVLKNTVKMKRYLILVTILNYLVIILAERNEDEASLIKQLLANYHISVKPNSLQTISFNLKLNHIHDLDENDQYLTSSAYLVVKWTDDRLSWNQTQSNLSKVFIKLNKIWSPNFWIANGIMETPLNLMASVSKSGSVSTFINLPSLKTECKLSTFYFPFDKQFCFIKIHNLDNINLTSLIINQKNEWKIEHPIWKIIDAKVEIKSNLIGMESLVFESLQEIAFNFTLKRDWVVVKEGVYCLNKARVRN